VVRLASLKTILRVAPPPPPTCLKAQAATSGGLPTWETPQGRHTNIHPFVGLAKGVKKK